MKKVPSLLLFFLLGLFVAIGQEDETVDFYPETEENQRMNLVKTNLSSVVLRNYHLSYERVLSKRFSIGAGFRWMPTGNVPLKNEIIKLVKDDVEGNEETLRDFLNQAEVSGVAFTLEPRFYIGKKGYGRGFFIAPYYRYASYELDNLSVDYESDFAEDRTIFVGGKINANYVGLMFGAQWVLSSGLTVDFWALGGNIGTAKGTISGRSDVGLSQTERDEIENAIRDIEFSDMIQDIRIGTHEVSVDIKLPWYGIRALGIGVGYAF